MKIQIPKEKCCSGNHRDDDRCLFFYSNYCDEDPWYSGNPHCVLYNKSIKNEITQNGCDKDEDYFFNAIKPPFCKATEVVVQEK